MSVTLAPPHGAFRTRCADSTHPGQGHKRIFSRWHALCFLATDHFSSGASSRTDASHRHGLNRLGAEYESSLLQWPAPLGRQPFSESTSSSMSYTPMSNVESNRHFQFAFVLVTDAINYQNDHSPSTARFHTTRRPSPFPPRPWVL